MLAVAVAMDNGEIFVENDCEHIEFEDDILRLIKSDTKRISFNWSRLIYISESFNVNPESNKQTPE